MYIVGVAYGLLTEKQYYWLQGSGDKMQWRPGRQDARRFEMLEEAARAAYLNTSTLPYIMPTKIIITKE